MARLGWVASEQTSSRRRFPCSVADRELAMTAAVVPSEDLLPQSGQQNEAKPNEPADCEIEAIGGGFNPRLLAQILAPTGSDGCYLFEEGHAALR